MVNKIYTGTLTFLLIACNLLLSCSTLSEKDKAHHLYDSPEMGDKAPGFWMKNQDQMRISLSDFAGKKNVILVFFPLAFTPV